MDFLNLLKDATLVLTESGGLQQETTALGLPCLTLCQNTERSITRDQGINALVGTSPERNVSEAASILFGRGKPGTRPALWDGTSTSSIVDNREIGDVLVSMGKAPEEGAQYLRRFRDMKYYETLYELLAKQYEVAKIDEAKDAAVIQVLDKAITPERKTKPKRSLIVLLTGLVAGFLGMLWAFVKGSVERARQNPNQLRQLQLFRGHLLRR